MNQMGNPTNIWMKDSCHSKYIFWFMGGKMGQCPPSFSSSSSNGITWVFSAVFCGNSSQWDIDINALWRGTICFSPWYCIFCMCCLCKHISDCHRKKNSCNGLVLFIYLITTFIAFIYYNWMFCHNHVLVYENNASLFSFDKLNHFHSHQHCVCLMCKVSVVNIVT